MTKQIVAYSVVQSAGVLLAGILKIFNFQHTPTPCLADGDISPGFYKISMRSTVDILSKHHMAAELQKF